MRCDIYKVCLPFQMQMTHRRKPGVSVRKVRKLLLIKGREIYTKGIRYLQTKKYIQSVTIYKAKINGRDQSKQKKKTKGAEQRETN